MSAEQQVVIYDGDRKGVVFDTAYTHKQLKDTVARCVARYGHKANVRAVLSKGHRQPT